VGDGGAPVTDAVILLTAVGYSVRSDSLGQFLVAGTPGSTLRLSFRATGFRDDTALVTLPRRGALTRDFVMVSADTPLPEVNPSDRVLRGRVTDLDGGPLSFANIQVNGGRRVLADDSGRFVLPNSTSGRFWLIVRRIGFEPEEMRLAAMPDTAIRIRMKPVAVSLPEQRIEGKAAFVSLDLGGFYRRMKDAERGINHGYFLTPEDFEIRKPTLITNMAEGVPATKVYHNPGNARKNIIQGLNGCQMTVYLDRIRVVGKLPGRVDDFVNELIEASTVAAMEIYPRAVGAPPEYQALNGTCGVVLLWTK
jgi:hypothetical protein